MIRLFELFWTCTGLILLAPLLLGVAAAIKLEDGGPVFYRQERIGQGGKPFRILKFRTMTPDADRQGGPLTVGADARITRTGRWLRRFKLDELPQLFNVLRGEMGLVGPRPEVPRYVALYTAEQAEVLRLRPGITDAASIAYRNENDLLPRSPDPEAFYIEHIMPNKIRINLEFAAGATLWAQTRIILATLGLLPPPVAIRQPGDLRASDRIPVGGKGLLVVQGAPATEVRPLDLSQGGVRLGPGAQAPLGSACEVTLTPEGADQGPLATAGVVIRTDDQGLVVRFTRPLAEKSYKSFNNPG